MKSLEVHWCKEDPTQKDHINRFKRLGFECAPEQVDKVFAAMEDHKVQ